MCILSPKLLIVRRHALYYIYPKSKKAQFENVEGGGAEDKLNSSRFACEALFLK